MDQDEGPRREEKRKCIPRRTKRASNLIADFETFDVLADGGNGSGEFVAEDEVSRGLLVAAVHV